MKSERKLIAGLSAAALALSCMSFAAFAEDEPQLNSFEPTKENVKIIGRGKYFEEKDGYLWFGLTDTGVEYKFDGTTTTLNVDVDANDAANNPVRIKIYADGDLYLDALATEKNADFIVNFDEAGEHTVKFLKISECENGTLRLNEIKTDAESIQPTAAAEKKIEFIGDSITCAYGVDANNPSFTTKDEDGTLTYAYKTAQKFNADYSMVSFSGFGIYSGYPADTSNPVPNEISKLPKYYDKLGYSWWNTTDRQIVSEEWDAAEFDADLIVINLGTNDASYLNCVKDEAQKETEKGLFVEEYKNFIAAIRALHPDAEILCTVGIMGQDLYPEIEQAVKETNDSKVNAFMFNVQNTDDNGVGVDWHPSALSHVDAAYELITEIESLYGWTSDPDVDIDIHDISATISRNITITEGDTYELPVKVHPAGSGNVTYSISDTGVVVFDGEDDKTADKTVDLDASGNASVTITAAAAGVANVTATSDYGLSTNFKITVKEAEKVSEPDSESETDSSSEPDDTTSKPDSTSSEADSAADSDSSSGTSSQDSSSSDSSSSSSSSSSAASSAASTSKDGAAAADTNPATGAASAAAVSAVILALGAIAVSKKSRK